MSTPEIIPEQPQQPDVEVKPEQFIVPETAQQLGVTAPPKNPKPLVSDPTQAIVQPAPAAVIDTTPVLAVPPEVATSEKELEKGATGPSNLSVTWLDMYWLREVGKALTKGWRVLFGQKPAT